MSYYFMLISIICIEWFLFFPNAILRFELPCIRKKYFLLLVCIELILFAGLRGVTVGADTVVYLKALNYYKGIDLLGIIQEKLVYPFDFEIGYFIFSKVCSFLSLNDMQFMIIVAFIIYIPLFKFIYEFSEQSLLSVLLYFSFGFFAYSLGIFRQMIAMSISLIGFKYVLKREPLKYFSIIFLASLFHSTAVVMIAFYFISRININNKLLFIFFVEIFLMFFSRPIILIIVSVFPQYSSYIGSMYDIQGGSYIMLILLNCILVFSYMLMKKNITLASNSVFITCLNGLILAIFLQILGYSFGIFGRIVCYFSIYLIILIPIILKRINKNVLNIFILIIVLFFVFYIFTKDNIYIVPFYFNKIL